jgi:hypothetical protein
MFDTTVMPFSNTKTILLNGPFEDILQYCQIRKMVVRPASDKKFETSNMELKK